MHDDAHRYEIACRWAGSTAEARYSRRHEVTSPEVEQALPLSSDTVFGGDGTLLNPEELVVAAASSCQLLSFLAFARRRKVEVLAYEDDAVGEMPTRVQPMAIARIELRPRIVVRGDVEDAVLQELTEEAHRGCFVANSLRTEVVVEPTFERAA
jgi:organic hydroperoxide reductase OsmC/OhrA